MLSSSLNFMLKLCLLPLFVSEFYLYVFIYPWLHDKEHPIVLLVIVQAWRIRAFKNPDEHQ